MAHDVGKQGAHKRRAHRKLSRRTNRHPSGGVPVRGSGATGLWTADQECRLAVDRRNKERLFAAGGHLTIETDVESEAGSRWSRRSVAPSDPFGFDRAQRRTRHDARVDPTETSIEIRLLGAPIALRRQSTQHGEELLREMELIAGGQEAGVTTDVPRRLIELVGELRQMFGAQMATVDDEFETAAERGESAVDVRYEFAPSDQKFI